jgi:hypothetical protein
MSFPGDRIVVAGFLVAACAREPVAPPPAPPVDWRSFAAGGRKLPPKVVPTAIEEGAGDGYLAALLSPQLTQLASLLDRDAHGSFLGCEGVYGRDKVVRLHELLFGAFDDRTFVATRVLSAARMRAIEWTMGGLQARDWMTIAPTHETVAFKGVTLLWVNEDGTVADVHLYFDTTVVKGQLGVGPKQLLELPPAPPHTAMQQQLDQMGTPIEMENVATVRGELGALEAEDEIAYLSHMADNVEIYTLERRDPMRGKVAARRYYEALDHAIAQVTTTIDHIWGIQAFVVVEYSLSGLRLGATSRAPMMADPKVVGLNIVDVVELSDGRIARIWRYDGGDVGQAAVDAP